MGRPFVVSLSLVHASVAVQPSKFARGETASSRTRHNIWVSDFGVTIYCSLNDLGAGRAYHVQRGACNVTRPHRRRPFGLTKPLISPHSKNVIRKLGLFGLRKKGETRNVRAQELKRAVPVGRSLSFERTLTRRGQSL